jgi:hypothetical protein
LILQHTLHSFGILSSYVWGSAELKRGKISVKFDFAAYLAQLWDSVIICMGICGTKTCGRFPLSLISKRYSLPVD